MASNCSSSGAMVNLYSIIKHCLRVIVVAFVFLISNHANAAYTYTGSCTPGYYSSLSGLIAACGAGGINICKPFDVVASCTGYSGGVDTAIGTTVNGGTRVFLWRAGTPDVPTCPAGQTYNSSTATCECPTNTHKLPINNYNSAEICVPNSACKAGTKYTGGLTSQAAAQGWACKQDDGCKYNVSSSSKNAAGEWFGTMIGMGAYCDVSGDGTNSATPSTSDEQKCIEQGKTFGKVNDVTVCVPPVQSNTKSNTTSTSTNGDGSTTNKTTTTTTTVNPDNTVTTTSTTSSSGTGAGGTPTTPTTETETKTEDKTDYCKANPTAEVCKDSSFTGSCGGAFACNGDAVQCAIAQDIYKRHCTLFDTKTALSDIGIAAANGAAITSESPLNSSNKINIDLGGKLDMSRGLSGTCIPSKTINVMGKSITIDTTEFCKWADAFGYLVVAISLMGAVKIIGRGM